jgi:hypothetical protein
MPEDGKELRARHRFRPYLARRFRLVIGSALRMSPMAAYVGAESQSLGLMRWHALSAPVAGRAVLQ